ncbi:MAG: hypothetical protein A3D92_05975 [Bacteroidetes bacterium RIFCSPHIGHO2_02_FULL_44_7]|nr:MAG: hypothetical protein A3D92_05975 [Bacteroidetes bacterium RIFCSPHIGHO2_02_FULL_44_7]
MKKLLLLTTLCCALQGSAQTTIYQETFESGNSFTMNSTDMGGAATYNTWLMNNNYTGGSGSFVCLSFPFTFTVVNTPTQPGAITGSPSSNYMHITAQAAVSSGINCASYIPADGTCVLSESNFTKMTNAISTVGFSNVSFDFWWMCAGSADAFGELYYSLDNGATWVLKQSNLNNVTNWTQTAISDPLWDNQASIKFAFRFVNNITTTAADPSLCIDQIEVTGISASNTISTGNLSLGTWCSGTPIDDVLDFTATGTYNGGNVYTAQLSDAAGSFAAPTTIGTLISSASGTLSVNINIPGATPAGSSYRVRVIASNPATVGSDNGSDIVINPSPTVTLGAFSDVCVYTPSFSVSGGSPAGGSYSGTGVTAGVFDPATAGLGSHTITYTFIAANSCLSSASQTILVDACAGLNDLENEAVLLHPNPASTQFSLASTSTVKSVQLVDMHGRTVKRFNSSSAFYDIAGIQSGVYFVHIEFEGSTSIKQLVIR